MQVQQKQKMLKRIVTNVDIYSHCIRHGGVANDLCIETVANAYARKRHYKALAAQASRLNDRKALALNTKLFMRADMIPRIYTDRHTEQM